MKKYAFASLGLLLLNFAISAQDTAQNFGVKGGINLGKYSPNNNQIKYNFKPGFYVGGFYNLKIDEETYFQPELLFALQGSQVKQNIEITDLGGNPLPNTAPYNFEYEIYESTISIPLMLKWYFFEKFYMESGPQLGFIINRSTTSSQHLLSGTDSSFIMEDGDTFDFGVSLGFGFDISDSLSINTRAFTGLTKRDNDIKSFVLNLGMEYQL